MRLTRPQTPRIENDKRDQRDERGSMAVAVAVLMVLTMLSTAVLARTLAGIHSVRQGQDFNAALASADAGVSDALFKIDQLGSVATIGPVTGSVAAGTFKYKAAMVDDQTYTITAMGTVNGRPHGVQATAYRQLQFPFALFGVNGIRLNGNGGDNIHATRPDGSIDPNRRANIGSNHAIDVNGGGGGDGQYFYTNEGSCSGCSAPSNPTGPYQTPDPALPTSPAPGGCPGAAGVVSGVLSAGTYVCSTNVRFSGTVTLGGPVKIYMTNAASNTAGTTLDISDSLVNMGGNPVDLQIYKIGAGVIEPGNGSHAGSVAGILYAPGADMTVNGGHVTWTGALVVGSFRMNGNPNFEMRYDQRVESLVLQNWKIKDYTEIPSSRATTLIG
ncbi:MAG: hypothetical protein QOK43_719 [Acidimicrobiaceae bacterium]|nr:hypothetical protein [Acidimicrobiaceae bacterium]